MQYRSGETKANCFRSERIFNCNGEWYFSTREHLGVGPFASRERAEIELMLFIRFIKEGGFSVKNYLKAKELRATAESDQNCHDEYKEMLT